MLRRFMLALFVSLLSMSTVSYAAAPDRVNHWELGVLGGGAFNDKSDDTGYAQAGLNYGVTPWIAIGVEGGWQESDLSDTEELGVVSIMGDIIIRVAEHPFEFVPDTLVPYGVVGLGVIGAYVTNEPATAAGQGDDVDDTSFGWKIGGGFDWFFNENWAVNFEVAYFDGDAELPNTTQGNDGLDFVTVGGGLKFVF